MCSRLSCLRVLEPTAADTAERVWVGLSCYCHLHADEVTPGQFEIRKYSPVVAALNLPVDTSLISGVRKSAVAVASASAAESQQ